MKSQHPFIFICKSSYKKRKKIFFSHTRFYSILSIFNRSECLLSYFFLSLLFLSLLFLFSSSFNFHTKYQFVDHHKVHQFVVCEIILFFESTRQYNVNGGTQAHLSFPSFLT
jgi:hypothetical protein